MKTGNKNILDFLYENQDWIEEAFMASYDLLVFMRKNNCNLIDISIKTGLCIEILDNIIKQVSKVDKEILLKIESAYNTKIFEFEEDLAGELYEYNPIPSIIELPNTNSQPQYTREFNKKNNKSKLTFGKKYLSNITPALTNNQAYSNSY